MKNRRFTTKVASDGDENETTISANDNHVELTLFRWYLPISVSRPLVEGTGRKEKVGSRKEKVENVDGGTLVRWLGAQLEAASLIWIPATDKLPVSQKVEVRFKKIRPERTSPAAKIQGRPVSNGWVRA